MEGRYSSTIRSFRVVDVRYQFEYEGGHIQGAENWQHGEVRRTFSGTHDTVMISLVTPVPNSTLHQSLTPLSTSP